MLCLDRGIGFSVENPRSSKIWEFEPIKALLRDPRVLFVTFDSCMYGEPHKKPTAVITNVEGLIGLSRKCNGLHHHQLLRGTQRVRRHGSWITEDRAKAAGAYSAALTQQWASLLEHLCPTAAKGSSLDSLAEVDGQLKLAADRPRLVGPGGSASSCLVTDAEVSKLLSSEVVFGQHTKAEAACLRRRGSACGQRQEAKASAQGGPKRASSGSVVASEGSKSFSEDLGCIPPPDRGF